MFHRKNFRYYLEAIRKNGKISSQMNREQYKKQRRIIYCAADRFDIIRVNVYQARSLSVLSKEH